MTTDTLLPVRAENQAYTLARGDGLFALSVDDGSPLFIGAPNKRAIRAVLAPWRRKIELVRMTCDLAEIDLPGGTMALLALALRQWGPPP